MSVFDRRVSFKPFEYPEAVEFKNAINHSYWLVNEWNFISDVQDYSVHLDENERRILKNAILAISQIEVSVKRFWTRLGDRLPKSEFEQVGITYGESEIRHADAYSHLLQVLGLNNEFDLLLHNPVIEGRVEYLTKYLTQSADSSNESFLMTLALFSLFIENVSLFSQFAVIKSFNRHRNILKDIDNVVQATQQEETIHALFGVYLINQIKKEFPQWFNPTFYERLSAACQKAYEAESRIIDWMFASGELPFLKVNEVKEYTKKRFNDSLEMIGGRGLFTIDKAVLDHLKWFDDEIHADVNTDFFHKKPVTYSKKVHAIKAEDLF